MYPLFVHAEFMTTKAEFHDREQEGVAGTLVTPMAQLCGIRSVLTALHTAGSGFFPRLIFFFRCLYGFRVGDAVKKEAENFIARPGLTAI